MSDLVLRHDDDAGLCTLTLNRPDKLNALNTALFLELDAHLSALAAATESIGCVVLRGAGKAFCSGADLEAIQQGVVVPSPAFKSLVVERLAELPQPVIAAVHGYCFTGGLELALAADLIVASASARFADTHGKWGFVGAWGMPVRLPRRIGTSQAKRLMLTGARVAADEALRLGLVDLCAEDDAFDAALHDLTTSVLANSWHTNRETKRLMRETDGMPFGTALSHAHYRHPGAAPDSSERIARFNASKR
jgi:enoyl-CoA hydratase